MFDGGHIGTGQNCMFRSKTFGGTIRYVINRSISYSLPNLVLVSGRGTHFSFPNPTSTPRLQTNSTERLWLLHRELAMIHINRVIYGDSVTIAHTVVYQWIWIVETFWIK